MDLILLLLAFGLPFGILLTAMWTINNMWHIHNKMNDEIDHLEKELTDMLKQHYEK